MKKRIICLVLFSFIFLLTGCDATYELEYKDGFFTETIEIDENYNNNNGDYFGLLNFNNDNVNIDATHKYDYYLEKKGNNNTAYFSYVYDDISYEKSKVLNNCFKYHTYKETDKTIFVKAYGGFTCEYLNNATVILKTDNPVVSSNASEVDTREGIYKWNFNETSDIYFQISKGNISNGKGLFFVSLLLKIFIVFMVIYSGNRLIKKIQSISYK